MRVITKHRARSILRDADAVFRLTDQDRVLVNRTERFEIESAQEYLDQLRVVIVEDCWNMEVRRMGDDIWVTPVR